MVMSLDQTCKVDTKHSPLKGGDKNKMGQERQKRGERGELTDRPSVVVLRKMGVSREWGNIQISPLDWAGH